jgi:hypothetical protein
LGSTGINGCTGIPFSLYWSTINRVRDALRNGQDLTIDSIREGLEKDIEFYSHNYQYYSVNIDSINYDIEHTKKEIDHISSIMTVPFEDVPLYINDPYPIDEIAKDRLKNAK